MDVSGFFLSGLGDDDEDVELSGTLFPKRRADIAKPAQSVVPTRPWQSPWQSPLQNTQPTLQRSRTQLPRVTTPYERGMIIRSASEKHFPKKTSMRLAACQRISADAHMVSPLTPTLSRKSTLSIQTPMEASPCTPRDLTLRTSAIPRSECLKSADRSSFDITIFLDLASPKLPPPLELPMTPEESNFGGFGRESYATFSTVPVSHPTASHDLYSYRLSSTTNVGQVPSLKSRALTPSGSWRFEVASHQDGLRMHQSVYSSFDGENNSETATLPGSLYFGLEEAKSEPFNLHTRNMLSVSEMLKDSKPLPSVPTALAPNSRIFTSVMFLVHAIIGVVVAQTLVPARTIGESLSGTEAPHSGEFSWIFSACFPGAAAFVLPGFRVASILGYKVVFVSSLIWLLLWTELVALAGQVQRSGGSGTAFVCSCRAMQGISLAFLVPAILDMLHQFQLSNVSSTLAVISGIVGFVVGGIVTALFATPAHWKWSFVSLALITLALGVLGLLVITPPEQKKDDTAYDSWWKRLDALGILTCTLGIIFFAVGINLLSVISFGNAYPYLLIILGAVILAAFLCNERIALRPILPVTAMTGRTCIALASLATYWASFFIWLWYLVQTLEHLRGWSPILTSAALIPLALVSIASAIALHLAPYLASPEVLLSATALLSCVGFILMATSPIDEVYWRGTFFSILLVSPGAVIVTQSAMRLISSTAAAKLPATPTVLGFAFVMFAVSIAFGVSGAIEKSLDRGSDKTLSGYRGAQYMGIGIGGLGVVLSLCILITGHLRR
ncbi:Low affinity ammonium transporter [Paramyrothecium foliicola]|nr:Low affinity ammonium transporter [Paramyrothecium foliicola]